MRSLIDILIFVSYSSILLVYDSFLWFCLLPISFYILLQPFFCVLFYRNSFLDYLQMFYFIMYLIIIVVVVSCVISLSDFCCFTSPSSFRCKPIKNLHSMISVNSSPVCSPSFFWLPTIMIDRMWMLLKSSSYRQAKNFYLLWHHSFGTATTSILSAMTSI